MPSRHDRTATFVERVRFDHRLGGRTREELGIPETVEESFVLRAQDSLEQLLARRGGDT